MNIGIIVYSHTGNSYHVAEKIKEKLSEKDNRVSIERLEAEEIKKGEKKLKRENLPDLSKYEALIIGSHVEAFSLEAIIKSYLEEINTLENKDIFCFLTKALPFNWTGGSRSIATFKKLCQGKKANVCGTAIVKWPVKTREKDITNLINKIEEVFF